MTVIPDKLQQIPPSVVAVSDYEALARERVEPAHWAYLTGGAEDELTLAENIDAFKRMHLQTRVMRDLKGGHTRLTLFGQDLLAPLLLAPIAYHKLAHPDGELATALGAAAAKTGMIVSTQASVPLEDVAREASPAAPLWFQLYIQPDRQFTRRLVERVAAAGYQALVVTVDAPVAGLRNRERRAGFALPEHVHSVNLRGMAMPPPQAPYDPDRVLLGGDLLAHAPTWADLAWLKSISSLPLLVKGIMCAADAEQAIAAGADGLVVSNHGGRLLDSTPASITVLPEIVAAVNGRVPVLLDSGVRRGSDVFKALALGASAVLIGRPYIYGLAAAGAVGVAHVIQILRAELEIAMALTGCKDLASITSDALRGQGGARVPCQ